MCWSSEPSAASRGRAAYARWPTSALAVGRDPLGALVAPIVATVASAAMAVSAVLTASGSGDRCHESAQLLQLDPERNMTTHSCDELRYTRATAAERQPPLVFTLFHAVHAAHTCASCIVHAAAL